MNLAVFIGKRLSLKAEGRSAPSPGIVIAIAGIALSFIIMLISISIVSGFKKEITEKLMGFISQISIYPPENDSVPGLTTGIRYDNNMLGMIHDIAPEASVSISMCEPVILKTDNNFRGLILKGLDKSQDWNFVKANITSGKLPGDTSTIDNNTIVISRSTADMLGLYPGDKVKAHFFNNSTLRTRNLKITGVYDTHFSEYDAMYAYCPITLLQKLCKVDSITGSIIEINGVDREQIPYVAGEITNRLLNEVIENGGRYLYRTETVYDRCAMYFNWLDLLDTNVVVIIALMLCVSGFTLISSLFIIILERVRMIGLLKALGATNAQVRAIFIYMTERLVFKGLIIGNVVAVGLLMLQHYWHILPLDADAYYINYVPVDLELLPIVILNIGVILVSFLLLIIPSGIIARLSPANSMRYE